MIDNGIVITGCKLVEGVYVDMEPLKDYEPQWLHMTDDEQKIIMTKECDNTLIEVSGCCIGELRPDDKDIKSNIKVITERYQELVGKSFDANKLVFALEEGARGYMSTVGYYKYLKPINGELIDINNIKD
jgi:hypothetical protein